MKANELMIGDLVRVNRDGLCIKKDTIVEVRGVDADDRLVEKGLVGCAHCNPLDENQFAGGIWCEYLEPIPLNPEILEKNGIKNEIKLSVCGNGEYNILWWVEGSWLEVQNLENGNECSIYCPYVHLLQHAICLCGIEKEITLY